MERLAQALPIKSILQNLGEPEPGSLEEISGNGVRPVPVGSVEGGLAGEQIDLGGGDPAGPLDELPGKVENEVDGNTNVSGGKVGDVEGLERGKPVEDDDDGEEDQRCICEVRLERGLEDQGVAVDALGA